MENIKDFSNWKSLARQDDGNFKVVWGSDIDISYDEAVEWYNVKADLNKFPLPMFWTIFLPNGELYETHLLFTPLTTLSKRIEDLGPEN